MITKCASLQVSICTHQKFSLGAVGTGRPLTGAPLTPLRTPPLGLREMSFPPIEYSWVWHSLTLHAVAADDTLDFQLKISQMKMTF